MLAVCLWKQITGANLRATAIVLSQFLAGRATAIVLSQFLASRGVSMVIQVLMDTIVCIAQVSYLPEHKHTPWTVLQLYNCTWYHHELLQHLIHSHTSPTQSFSGHTWMTSYVMQVCDLCEVCEVCEVLDSQVGAHQVMSLWGSLHGPLRWRWLAGWGMQEKAIPPHMPCVLAHKTDVCSGRSEWNTCPNSTCGEFHLWWRAPEP